MTKDNNGKLQKMKKRVKWIPTVCEACGGQIKRKDKKTFECIHCGSRYYVSQSSKVKIGVNLSVKTMITTLAMILLLGTIAGMGIYSLYTQKLVKDASRFSMVFREFLLRVYDKPIVDIDEEELSQIKYLRIEKDKGYLFTYSFEDYYAYEDAAEFEKTLASTKINANYDEFSPSNVQYFTGLTRLEIYVDGWQNYLLPEENQIRGIFGKNGVSKYGEAPFFENINPETIEEIVIYEEEGFKELYFLKDISCVKNLTLERAAISETGLFTEFDRLEQLHLRYPVLKEASAYEIVEGILQCENLKKFILEGKSQYYITEEQWQQLEETYGDRVAIERK